MRVIDFVFLPAFVITLGCSVGSTTVPVTAGVTSGQTSATRDAPSAAGAMTPSEDAAATSDSWWTESQPCLGGAELKGAAPPQGNAVWCEQAGKPHGPKTTFYPGGQRETTRTYYQ